MKLFGAFFANSRSWQNFHWSRKCAWTSPPVCGQGQAVAHPLVARVRGELKKTSLTASSALPFSIARPSRFCGSDRLCGRPGSTLAAFALSPIRFASRLPLGLEHCVERLRVRNPNLAGEHA